MSRWAKSLGLKQKARLLTAEEERALASRVKSGDRAARDELILANLPLAIRIASHFESSGMTFDDIVQEAVCGLIRAVEGFDPQAHGTRFSSYAVYWISQAIQRALSRNSSLVRVPDYLWRLQYRLQRLVATRRNREYDADATQPDLPSPDELAAEMGISLSRLGLLQKAGLEQRQPTVCEDGVELPLEEQVPDHFSPQEELEKAEQIRSLYGAVEALPPVEAWIIRRRYRLPEPSGTAGADHPERPRDYDTLAALLGVSRKRVHDLERSALRRLREVLDGEPRGNERGAKAAG